MKKHALIFTLLLTIVNYSFSQISNNDSIVILLNRNHLEAQTKNQQAQSEYYKRQSNPASTVLAGLVPVLGTILGALIAYLSLLAQSKRNSKIEQEKLLAIQRAEKEKNELVKEKEEHQNSKIAAAELMKKTAVATHNLTWILWIAKNDSTSFCKELMEKHDEKMNLNYAEIASAQVMLSAYNKLVFDKTKEIVIKLYNYDGDVGKLFIKYKNGDSNAINDLGNLWREVYDFSSDIPNQFASILELALPAKPVTNMVAASGF